MRVVTESSAREVRQSALLAKDEGVGIEKTFLADDLLTAGRKEVEVDAVRVAYTSTATAGTRLLRLRHYADDDVTVLHERVLSADASVVASTTAKRVAVLLRLPYELDGSGEFFDFPEEGEGAPISMRAGESLVVEDTEAIDVLDTCKVYLLGRRRF